MVDKNKLIKILKNEGMTITEARHFLNTVLNYLSDSLCEGEAVVLTGFGSFYLKNYKEKLLGKKLMPKHKRIVFKPSDNLREAVNKNGQI